MEVDVPEVRKTKTRIKLRLNNLMTKYNNDDPFGYLALEKFFDTNNLCVSSTFVGAIYGDRPLERIIYVWYYFLLQAIVIIRLATLSIIDKPWIWRLLVNPLYILEGQRLINLMLICLALVAVFGQYLLVTCESKDSLSFNIFLQKIKYNQDENKLKLTYYLKFCKMSKFVVKLFLGPCFKVIIYTAVIITIFSSIKAYSDPNMDFSITALILSFVFVIIWLKHSFAVILGSFIYIYVTTLHLKYQFKQIKDQIQKCVKSGNSRLIVNAIHKHNYCSECIHNFNKFYSLALFLIYFLATPTIDIFIYLVIHKLTNVYMRIIFALLWFQLVIALYVFTYILSSLSSSAHNLTSDLYAFLVRNRCYLRHKLKIISFIEKLSGPVIGIYCYNLFAFTTFEFYQYMAFISSTYFLLNNLIF